MSEPPPRANHAQPLLTNPLDDARLLQRIGEVAVLRGRFTLRSGRTSTYYIDKYLFETQPDILAALGHRFARCIDAINRASQDLQPHPGPVRRLAGAELGGIPLVAAAAMATGLPMVLVRNQKKDYGTARQLEGRVDPGDRVVIVEDIATTGGQSLEAARILADAGATVAAIIVVIDRQEGARENIEAAGLTMHAIFTRDDLQLEDSTEP